MKAPYFELKKDEDFDSVASNIIENSISLHFTRRRNILPGMAIFNTLRDEDARSWFDEGRERTLKRFNAPIKNFYKYFIMPVAFLLVLSVIIYHAVVGTFTKSDYDIGVMIFTFVLCFVNFAISVFSFLYYIRTYRFLKKSFIKMDDLYVVHDRGAVPCSVTVRGKITKVLYKNTLYTIKNGKIKSTTSDNYLYRAYLNMLPWAVLDLDKFYPNERYRIMKGENFKPVQTNTYIQGNKCCISLDNRVLYYYGGRSQAGMRGSHAAVNRPLQFIKYLFEFDEDFQIETIYSAANESFRFGLEYITKASIANKGETALSHLKAIIHNNNALEHLWNDSIKISL